MNQSQINHSRIDLNIPTITDLIRQEYFDAIHPNKSISNFIFDYKGKIENFLQNTCKILDDEIQTDTLNEIINDIESCFSIYPKSSLPCFKYFLPKYKLNSNYIIIISSIISELTIVQQRVKDELIDFFVDESLKAILLQIPKNINDISLFEHIIPQQFKNNLIINLLISSKLTKKQELFFLDYILPNYLYSTDRKFNFLLQKVVDSSLINISIDNFGTERELITMISDKDIKFTSNLNENTLLFLCSVMAFIHNNGKKDIKGLNTSTILPFLAIMTIYLQNYRKPITFDNKKFPIMILKGIELLGNGCSDLLNKSISYVILSLDFLKQKQIISYDQFTKINLILGMKFFKRQLTFDINLILPSLIGDSFYYYPIFNMHGMDLFNYMVKNCSSIDYLKTKKLNLGIFQLKNISNLLKNLILSDKSTEVIQTIHFLNHYCCFTELTNKDQIINLLVQFMLKKIDTKCWDDAIIAGQYIEKYGYIVYRQMIIKKFSPNHKFNILLNRNKDKLNINELLSCYLNETNIEQNTLFFIMIKNQKICRCYLEHQIYNNSENDIECSKLLQKLSNQYEKYQNDFIYAVKKQFNIRNNNTILYKKEYYKLHYHPNYRNFPKIGYNIIEKCFCIINSKPENSHEFICLFKIAKDFPFLFYNDPYQAFKSVLQPFDFIQLIYNDLKNENRDIFINNIISAMSFLFMIIQFPFILDNFLQWFFTNIMTFTNSQIFGFILLLSFFTQGNKSKIILGYIIKYKFIENIEKILKKENQDSEFKKQFLLEINYFIINIFHIMMNISKYEIIHIEELMKNNHPISYMNFPLFKCNNLDLLMELFKKYLTDKDEKGFLLFTKYLTNTTENAFPSLDKEINDPPPFDQIKDLIGKIYSNTFEFKKTKNIPQFYNYYTIKMVRYLVMQPQFIYSWFLYGEDNVMTDEQIEMIAYTCNALNEMHNNAKENPNNNENSDCELLNTIDYFKPQITMLFNLVLFISPHLRDDDLFDNLIQKIINNCEYLIYFIDFLFQHFKKLSSNYDEINLQSMKDLIDLFDFLLLAVDDEYEKEILDFLECNLIDLALSPKWRNDLNFLQKTVEILVEYDLNFTSHVVQLIKLFLIENNGKLASFILLYNKLDQEPKDKIYNIILTSFDKTLFHNDVKTIIDCCNTVPTLFNDKLKSMESFLNKNADYFKNKDNLDKKAIKFLLNSFNSLALHYNTKNADNTELSPDFFKIYDKYNNLFNFIIKMYPKKLRKFNFLINHPELLSFDVRLRIFNNMVKKIKLDDEIKLEIDRNNILGSSYLAFNHIESLDLLKSFNIKFINEMGLDLGGPLRDWYTNLSHEIFNPNFALFSCDGQEKKYQPNKKSFVNENHLQFFKFVGKVVAHSILDGICINVNFTISFWKQILGYEPNINDLKEIDLELYNSLQSLIDVDVNSLGLSFAINEDEYGSYLSIPLKENGNIIDVTNENKNEYIQLHSNYILKGSIENQVKAFCEGFNSIFSDQEIRMFAPKELNMLIGGKISIDVNDFRNYTKYEFPYTANTPVVKLFFDVISKWNNEKLSKLLAFITGSSRLPVDGFKGFCEMNGHIIIAPGGDKNHLPVAHTCFNRIDLPRYETRKELNEKLSKAIDNCNSFEII